MGGGNLDIPNVSLTSDNNKVYFETHEIVDLGLPNGTKWATKNIGATSDTEYGLYFQWGATIGYIGDKASKHSNEETAPGYPNFNAWNNEHLTECILNSDVDAATVNWGSKWRMPTPSDFTELINGTVNGWTTKNNVGGYAFFKKKDNDTDFANYKLNSDTHIFFPASGVYAFGNLNGIGETPSYWCSICEDDNTAYWMNLNDDEANYAVRYYAVPIRTVLA